ncbi:MAG TPA: hypothetical protein VFW38_07515 [Solirubrobacteraceae bacterium]|nr:hypothetical protein [Solirubrobacteraceae bacterium]
MRLRALPVLLALTAADYALWHWSIANSHDIVSLVSGLTLLPLLAATLAMLALGATRLLGFVLRRRSAHSDTGQRPAIHPVSSAPSAGPAGADERTPRRLAA